MQEEGKKGLGKVILVGGGPGDPSLVTVAGLRALRAADVVLYDNLAPPELIREAPRAAERIYVGKQAGRHALKQAEINALLVQKAREGQMVVRLKGGDPYIFGRGAEEAHALTAAGVRFEIVPGITAATAASLYAGIPLTDRRHAATLTFVAGHTAGAEEDDPIEWEALARLKGTIVFYMGVRAMPAIVAQLLQHGLAASTPAAVVENAAMPCQRTIAGTLESICRQALAATVQPPALFIVGEVVSLHPELAWYEGLPLFGRRVAVTRASERLTDMGLSLRALGAQVYEIPTIEIRELPLSDADRDRIADVSTYDGLVLTSGAAVDTFFEHLRGVGLDSRALAGVAVATVGDATARRLARHGVAADIRPEQFVAESLVTALRERMTIKGARFLLPRSGRARATLVDALRGDGATVDDIRIYEPEMASTSQELIREVLDAQPDFITFTSSSTVENFVRILGEDAFAERREAVRAASIGPVTTRALRRHGIEPVVEADPHTVPALIHAMESACSA